MKYAILLLLATNCFGADLFLPEKFFKALHMVESSGEKYPADGDGGRSIGPFQIQEAYWKDAYEFDRSIGGTWQECRSETYARKVVTSYMNRYCKDSILNRNYEVLAKCHNGGPNWSKKTGQAQKNLQNYWEKFKKHL